MAVTFSADTDWAGEDPPTTGTVRNNAWKQAMATAINTTIAAAGTAYTPTWSSSGTAVSLGNGTLVGRYWQVDKLVTFVINLTMGSTTTFGTGNYRFTTPFTMAATVNFTQPALGFDSSAGSLWSGLTGVQSTTTVQIFTAGPAGSTAIWGQTTPFTWATSDTIYIVGQFERT